MTNRAAALAILLLAGCAADDGPQSVVEVGQFFEGTGPERIEYPRAASLGESVTISINTFGDGCVSNESTDGVMSPDGVDITPYDRRRIPGENEACIAVGNFFRHEAVVSFDAPGPAMVRIHARDLSGEALDVPLSIEIE